MCLWGGDKVLFYVIVLLGLCESVGGGTKCYFMLFHCSSGVVICPANVGVFRIMRTTLHRHVMICRVLHEPCRVVRRGQSKCNSYLWYIERTE